MSRGVLLRFVACATLLRSLLSALPSGSNFVLSPVIPAVSLAFTSPLGRYSGVAPRRKKTRNDFARRCAVESTEISESSIDDIRAMRVKEIKDELRILGIGTQDAFEKEELVRRLSEARVKRVSTSKGGEFKDNRSGASVSRSDDAVVIPLQFFSMETSKSVAASNTAEGNVFLRPSPGQFPAIDLCLPSGDSITLLVDTACSGVVIRPSVAAKHGLKIFSTPMTMTAAGGTSSEGTGVTQLDRFSIADESFGPLPAAVQDIGALPSPLDGIIGLSFLSQFECVEFDFQKGQMTLFKNSEPKHTPDGLSIVADGEMSYTRLGVWTVNALLDGRGPLKLLVDTGAASTILNWRGLSDMSLSRESSQVAPNSSRMGAMGADNIALALTHRIVLQRRFSLPEGTGRTSPGVNLKPGGPLNADIGQLPVLNELEQDGVGGILGSDLLMRCGALRLYLKGPNRRITLYK